MTIDSYMVFAGIAVAVSLIRYSTYIWSIYKGETRPHVFSWFNFGVITLIGAYAQFSLHAEISSFVLFLVAGTCFFISFIAIFVGEKNITKSDWFAFIGALMAIPIWQLTNDPFLAIISIVIIDSLSFYPTVRKSWSDPWGEPIVSALWAGSRYFFVLFTIPNPTIETLLYPLFLMATDWGFAVYIWARRYHLNKNNHL